MAGIQPPFIEPKSSSATESDQYLQQQFNKSHLEYGNLDTLKAAYGLSDMNDRVSELKNLKNKFQTQEKTKMSADMLRLEFPEIADRIKGDGYFEDYARVARRAEKEREYQKIMDNAPDTYLNDAAVIAGSIAGGINMVDVGISYAAMGLPFLSPFASNVKFAGALNFGVSNLVENIAAEPISYLSRKYDYQDYTAVDAMKNIAMGTISSQLFYTGISALKMGSSSLYGKYFGQKQAVEQLLKANIDEINGKNFEPFTNRAEAYTNVKADPTNYNQRKYYKFFKGEMAPGIEADSKSYLESILPNGATVLYDNIEAAKFDGLNSLGSKQIVSYDLAYGKVLDGNTLLGVSDIAEQVKQVFGKEFLDNNKDSSIWQMIEGLKEGIDNGKFSDPLAVTKKTEDLFRQIKANGFDGILKDMSDSDIPTNSLIALGRDKFLNRSVDDVIPKGLTPEEANAVKSKYESARNDYTFDEEASKVMSEALPEYTVKGYAEDKQGLKVMMEEVESLRGAGIISQEQADMFKEHEGLIDESLLAAKSMIDCIFNKG